MSLLANWVNSALAAAIGWTLLHSLWQGAIVAASLAGILAGTRSPRARYVAACAALLMMLGAFGATLTHFLPSGWYSVGPVRTRAYLLWNLPADRDSGGIPHQELTALVSWLAVFWMAGVWVFALRQAAGWLSLRRLRYGGVCSAPEHWEQQLTRLAERLKVSRPVRLLESCVADTPMVLGHFRPVILVPLGLLTGLPVSQMESILLHELAHIRRCDYLVNVIQRAVECLLFYHPAAWWVSRVIREERENCCDDMAVAAAGNAEELALALAAIEQQRCGDHAPAVAAGGGSLMKRIRRLLYPRETNAPWTLALTVVLFTVTVGVALAARSSKSSSQAPESRQRKASTTELSRYERWANEEVPYIITDQERDAFKNLKTDEERDMFIEQFWERRNPKPGSHENAFREEYYRRIAYANEHWASGKPGWKSDRGHLYILYGPPDVINSRPWQPPYPSEEWIYRSIEGLGNNVKFTFEDSKKNGDYPLVGSFPTVPSPKPAHYE